MKVVTPFEVADCQHRAPPRGRAMPRAPDRCRGAQSFWLEAEKERLDEAHAVIVEFFEKKGAKLRFDETGTYFTLQ